jgi:hypothetical protein
MTNRDGLFYVMPLGDIWLVRRIGTRADAYPTKEDAIAAARRLAPSPGQVRVLARPSAGPGSFDPPRRRDKRLHGSPAAT